MIQFCVPVLRLVYCNIFITFADLIFLSIYNYHGYGMFIAPSAHPQLGALGQYRGACLKLAIISFQNGPTAVYVIEIEQASAYFTPKRTKF